MARENLAFLRGAVIKKPLIIKKDDAYVYALANINVGRAERKVGDGIKYMKCDNPPIMTRDEKIMREMETWEPNDIVDIKGVISSKHINKGSICPYCGKKNVFPGAFVFINPIYAEKIASCESDEKALEYLVEHREISNQVFLFGTLCRDPKKITPKRNLIVTQYQIAMNRKYRIPSDPPEIKTDFPWVKSYGDNAVEDRNRLHVGSEVFIDGFLQARSINRKAICGQEITEAGKGIKDSDGNPMIGIGENGEELGCGKAYEWKDRAMEIVPYDTEYIGDYYTDEEVEEREAERQAQKLRDKYGNSSVDLSELSYGDSDDDEFTEEDLDAGIDEMEKEEEDNE